MSESETDTRDYEAEARESGWQPQENWKGPPEQWIDAKAFVENGEKILPIVNSRLRKALSDIDDLREGNRQFREFHEAALAKERKEREQAVLALEEERKKAVSDGDGEAFDRADKRLREIRSAPPPQIKLEAWQEEWVRENPWFTTDRELRAIADGLSDVVIEENPGLKGGGRAYMDKLKEKVMAAVPHKFSNARRDTSLTEDNGNRPQRKKERNYDSLPDDAKQACDKFCRTIPGFTKEKYLAEYQWSQQ